MSEINEIKDDNKIKVELLINTAINEFNLKEYKKSIDLFDQVIRIDSKILDVYTFKGLSLKNLHKNDEAIDCFNKVIELNPKNIDAHKYIAYILYSSQKYEKSIKWFDKVIELEQQQSNYSSDIYFSKAEALFKLKLNEDAIKCYNIVLQNDSNNLIALKNKIISLKNLNKIEEAIECLNKLIQIDSSNNLSFAYRYKGFLLYDLKKYDESIECFDKVIKLEQQQQQQNNEINTSCYSNDLNNYFKKLALEKQKQLEYLNKGNDLRNLNKNEEAIQFYDKLIEMNSNHLEAYYFKGLSLNII